MLISSWSGCQPRPEAQSLRLLPACARPLSPSSCHPSSCKHDRLHPRPLAPHCASHAHQHPLSVRLARVWAHSSEPTGPTMTSSPSSARPSRAGRPARPLSPPKISDRSPFPDEDEGVGLGQMVNKLRDVLGFRSSSSSTSASGPTPAAVGGSSTAPGALKPPEAVPPGTFQSGSGGKSDGLPGA